MSVKRVIIQQPDMDTCLTALILGVKKTDNISVRYSDASATELNNPEIYCLEAGGSGGGKNNNFDHHDPELYLPPACKQALECSKLTNGHVAIEKLTDYVCCIDECKTVPPIEFPSLSSLFSGMRLAVTGAIDQFFSGILILKTVIDFTIDPFGTMPNRPEWEEYISVKQEDIKIKTQIFTSRDFFFTSGGLKVGSISVPIGISGGIGGFHFLYGLGCNIVVLFHPVFGNPPVRKFTIGSNSIGVSVLLQQLNELEAGWGGRKTIIGSPRKGSNLSLDTVTQIIRNTM